MVRRCNLVVRCSKGRRYYLVMSCLKGKLVMVVMARRCHLRIWCNLGRRWKLSYNGYWVIGLTGQRKLNTNSVWQSIGCCSLGVGTSTPIIVTWCCFHVNMIHHSYMYFMDRLHVVVWRIVHFSVLWTAV